MEERAGQHGDQTQPYYFAYEQRYRRVYEQGVEFWTANPDEIRESTELLDEFLGEAVAAAPLILECGCGEGHLAEHLVNRGWRYIGVDISPTAIEKARSRLARCSPKVEPVFHVTDCTAMGIIPDGSADIVVDNFHFHMLVTDGDRSRYLGEVRRVLRAGGRAYFHENLQAGSAIKSAVDYDDFLRQCPSDFVTEEGRDAWQNGKVMRIQLPRLPARFNTCDGYAAELESAGLRVQLSRACGSTCVLHAVKPQT